MGKRGNWKKENYKIKCLQSPEKVRNGDDLAIIATDESGETVGRLLIYMNHSASFIAASDVFVHREHRRKGIATAMYQLAEQLTGKKMKPAIEVSDDPSDFSEDARAFWRGSRGRFG